MDTSAARAAIFSRIRKAQQRPVEPTAAELDQVQTYLASNKAGPQPDIDNDLVLRFRTQAELRPGAPAWTLAAGGGGVERY